MDSRISELGLTTNETRLYLLLVELGRASPSTLAKRLSIPRSTVYSVAETLQQRALISIARKGSSRWFVANEPQSLVRMISREHQEVTRRERIAQALAEELLPLFKSKSFTVPKLQIYEGKQNVENFLHEYSPIWSAAIQAADQIWWGYQDPSFVPQYLKWLRSYWASKPPDQKIQLLSNRSEIETTVVKAVPGREIRELPAPITFLSTIWICGSYVVMLSTRQDLHYGYQLNDPLFASTLRQMFAFIWDQSRPAQ